MKRMLFNKALSVYKSRGIYALITLCQRRVLSYVPCIPFFIAKKFDISRQFAKSIFTDMGVNLSLTKSINSVLKQLNDLQGMYISYALTTTIRGYNTYEAIHPFLQTQNQQLNYLDVGCAYGGFLRAFHRHNFNCTGVEINKTIFEYCKLNCMNLQHIEVINAGIEVAGLLPNKKFDCITCNDVLEHVENAEQVVMLLLYSLNVNGILCIEIPNKDYINFINTDGHFKLFGINLLKRIDADNYYTAMTGKPYDDVGMGEFYELEYYLAIIRALQSCRIELITNVDANQVTETPGLIAQLEASHQEWLKYEIDTPIKSLVEERYQRYLRIIKDEYSKIADNDADVEKALEYQRTYLTPFWRIIIKKGEA
ncbi:MAG: class I SAM-dependent methyltransferase [Armatimonadota bacterium]